MRVQLKKGQVVSSGGSTMTYHGGQTFELEDGWARELIARGDATDDAGLLAVCGAVGENAERCSLLNDHPAGDHADASGMPFTVQTSALAKAGG